MLHSDGEVIWDARCEVGESPVWDEDHHRLFFVDVLSQQIHCLNIATGRRSTFAMPEIVTSIGLCQSGRLIASLRNSVVLFDLGSNECIALAKTTEPDHCRLNDGKVGPDGCFWVGGMDERKPRQACAALYRITPDGKVERKAEGLMASNGLAWSPDGQTMFHADTSAPAIYAWDFDPKTGRISNRRQIAQPDEAQGRPDGGATDSDGCYWSAGVSSGCLNRFSPTGELMHSIKLPLPSPSMPCFAGDWLFVTSVRHGRDQQLLRDFPQLGGLMRLKAPTSGAPVAKFSDL